MGNFELLSGELKGNNPEAGNKSRNKKIEKIERGLVGGK
jgi:hypothetical protein